MSLIRVKYQLRKFVTINTLIEGGCILLIWW